jgi:WD40 repeat protein
MRCSRCDAELSKNTLGGLCAVCLLDTAFPDDASESGSEFHYDLIEEIGRGGMGVVYRAIQHGSQRQVAVKMILSEQVATPGMLERFHAEAEAVASLDHPNILPIYETGDIDGTPFYSMKLANGGTLRDVVSKFRTRSRETAAMVAAIGRAVHHAHQRGILHRDLKPGNILLEGNANTPFVSDFGLAKWLGRNDRLTIAASALGTPHYMAPEQAEGASAELTTAADVYSLGAIFYELLTGRPPFSAETALDTLRLVTAAAGPTSPRSIDPEIPRDLEVICLKCLAKEPGARYSSAAALVEDLDRWLEGRTILARRATKPERLWRWAKRNPVTATLAAACIALLFAVGIGTGLAAVRIAATRDRALSAEKDAVEKLYRSYLDQARASRLAGKRFESLAARDNAAQIHLSPAVRDETIAALALVGIRRGASWPRPPANALGAFDPQLERYAVQDKPRELSVRRTSDQTEIVRLQVPADRIGMIHSFSEDGRFLAAKSMTGLSFVWELATGRLLLRLRGLDTWTNGDAAFTPDGRVLAFARPEGGVAFYRLDNIPAVGEIDAAQPWRVWDDAPLCHRLAFDPTGEKLAMVDVSEGPQTGARDGVFQVRALNGTQPIFEFRQPTGYDAIDWSPDGNLIAVGSWDHQVYLHDGVNGELRHVLRGHLGSITDVRFSHDGTWLASIAFDSALRLWDVASGALLASAPGSDLVLHFSADNRRLGVGFGDGRMGWLEIAPADIFRVLHPPRHLNRPQSLAASSDGRLLASAGDGAVQLWDAKSGRPLELPDNKPGPPVRMGVRFAPDNTTLYCSSRRDGLHRWILHHGENGLFALGRKEALALPVDPECFLTDVSADGERLAVSYVSGNYVSVLSVRGIEPRQIDLPGALNAFEVALSPDGKWAAAGARSENGAYAWDLGTRRAVCNFEQGEGAIVVFSPDNRWLLTGTGTGYQFWHVGSWEKGPRLAPEGDARLTGYAAAFNPQGDILAVQLNDDRIALVNAHDASVLAMLEPPRPLRLEFLQFTGDGTQLAALGADQVIQLWNITTLRRELRTRGLDW